MNIQGLIGKQKLNTNIKSDLTKDTVKRLASSAAPAVARRWPFADCWRL